MISGLTTKIFSKLASNSSLLPIAVKDGAHTTGMTTASYITGKDVEGKDRFIDEAGTALIWIGGIPFYKKVIDFGIKIAKFDPKVDVRLFEEKSKAILKKAIEHAANADIKKALVKASEHKGLFQGIALGKFIASTALTLGSYWALTNFRHKHTEKTIVKEFHKEVEIKKANTANAVFFQKLKSSNPAFKQHNPSFGMNLDIKALKSFMFNPVNNMKIVDGGITAERLGESRNPQDFMGYVIKEGAFWGLMYYAGDMIQDHFLKKAADEGHPIDLDIKVLQDPEFKNTIKDGKMETDLKAFSIDKSDEEIYDSLFKAKNSATMSDNLVVKMAKQEGLIHVIKENENGVHEIDTRFHIDIEGIKKLKVKLATFIDKAPKIVQGDKKTETALDVFLKNAERLKQGVILKNIGITSFALGVVVPGVMLGIRYMNKDNKEFAVKKEIHEKLKKEHNLA